MGIYIDMDMPKCCWMCPCSNKEFAFCEAVKQERYIPHTSTIPAWCPLIEVPDGHGRLIDADALHQLFEEQWHYLQTLDWEENPKAEAKQDGVNWCINTMHDDAPTIIEAEEKDNEHLD